MSVGIDKLASELQKVIEEKDKNKKSPYDTEAEVVRVDSDVVWVKIPGGVDETPAQKTVNAKEGDKVQVRVSGGKAFLVGNGTNPPTDDRVAYTAMYQADAANENANAAGMAADTAIESANQANEKAIEATEFAAQAKTQAGEATEAANEAKSQASAATTAANQAKTQATEAETAANEAKTSAAEATTAANEAKTQASEATTAANQAKDDAAKANTAANGAVTSLGIVQGVVDGLSTDMDEMQTHVAMMDAVVDPDSGKTLVPAGLHVVPTSNGYFVVLSNDGMYVYDNESDLVAIFGENIKFDSIRPQRIGGDNAYIEYYDSDNDGKADSLRIVGANISASTGIPTKVSELQNDSGYTTKTYVDDAVGDTATDLANYILSNDQALEDLEKQIDGAIDTWYYAGDPTTSNEPAKNWTTAALKESHLRDLYFNTSNGHTWRWAKDGSTYKWVEIQDADAIKALADAAEAQSTANVKRRVFVTTPTPPYEVGDLWVGGSKGDIKKCKTPKTSSQSYAAADWELASKYTDDTNLNNYKTEVSNTYSTKVEVQQTESTLEGKITAAETSTKSYADGLIEQEVSDRNTAIQASADGITTSVSQNYTKTVDLANTDAVKAAKKAGTDAQSALNTYKTSNDAAVAAAKKAGDDAQADLDDYKDTVQETYATKTQLTQTESSIKSEVSSTYATKSSVPTKVSQLTNDSKYATQTQAQGYANTAESNAKADATTKANAAEANAKADTTEKLKSYSTTVQMNSAIEQKAGEISLAAAQTAEQNAKDYADGLDAKARPFVRGTQTAATGTWTGVCDELTELKDGQEILYFLPYAGSGNATLNLTLKDGTTTGAVNCYYSNTTRLTTHFGAGMTIPLVYHKNFTIGSTNYTGWWTLSQYNSDTYDRKRISNNVKVAEDIPQYIIAGRSGAGHKKLVGGLVVDLTYPICYLNQANASGKTYVVASGGTSTNFYTACPGVNLQNTKASWKGTTYSMCYIKGTLAGNFFTVHSDIFTTTVPTSDDGFAYIPIGMLYSDHQVNFACDNSLYGYRDNSFGPLALREASKLVSSAKAEIKITTDNISSEVSKKVGNSEIISKINQSAEEITIDASRVNIAGAAIFNSYAKKTEAVSNVVVEYAVGNNATTAPSSGWSSNTPTWTAGKYIWQRTGKTINGSTTYTYTCIQGAKGETGATGPQGPQGETGSKGDKGDKGDKGNPGTNGTSYYTYVRYSANANGSGMVATPSSTTKYIGLYTGTSSSVPAYTAFTWSKYMGENGSKGDKGDTGATGPQGPQGEQGIKGDTGSKGDKGDKGDRGYSVSEVKILYYLKSNTTAPSKPTSAVTSTSTASGVWTTAVPTYVANYSYFVCAQTKLSSGNYYWSDPTLDNGLTESNKQAASAVSKANSAAYEEQYIYISKASGTTSVSANTTWVTEAGDKQNTWTTKRPTYNTSYPVLFVAKQKKVVSGTVTCTTPVKDDTTTVIDGGHITTGTIDASKATITNINGENITAGTIKAGALNTNNINSSGVLTIGAMNTNTQNDILNSKLEIGGRNLHKNSNTLDDGWVEDGGTTVSDDGIATIPLAGSGNHRIYQTPANGYWGIWEANTTYTVSVDAKTDTAGLKLSLEPYANGVSAKTFELTTEWKRYSYTFTSGNATSTSSCSYFARNGTSGNVFIRYPKLEKGNKATDWTPAPEDFDDSVARLDVALDGIQADVSAVEQDADNRIRAAEASLDLKINRVASTGDLISNINAVADQISLAASQITIGNNTVKGNLDNLNTAVLIDTKNNTVTVGGLDNAHIVMDASEGVVLYAADGTKLGKYGSTAQIGDENSFHINIDGGELSFYQDKTTRVAYINTKTLFINQAQINDSLRIGQFRWQVKSANRIALVYSPEE